MRDSILLAETVHVIAAFGAEFGFERAGLVIKAGVNDSAVVAGLMGCQSIFGFKQHQPKVWPLFDESFRCSEPDNTAANNGYVERFQSSPGVTKARQAAPVTGNAISFRGKRNLLPAVAL